MKVNLQREFIFLIGLAVASIIMAAIYFGLSRLLNEYVATFVLAIVCSMQILVKFGDRAAKYK